MGLLFKFGQAVPENTWWGLLGALENWNGTQDSFFLLYSEITMEKLTYLYTPLLDF